MGIIGEPRVDLLPGHDLEHVLVVQKDSGAEGAMKRTTITDLAGREMNTDQSALEMSTGRIADDRTTVADVRTGAAETPTGMSIASERGMLLTFAVERDVTVTGSLK